jgi:hypothetical protein
MIELQKMRVTEHIADLEHEAAVLRAERERDRARIADDDGHARVTSAADVGASLRVRFGRWLVAIGEAVAGPASPCDDDGSVPNAA